MIWLYCSLANNSSIFAATSIDDLTVLILFLSEFQNRFFRSGIYPALLEPFLKDPLTDQ